MGHAQFEADHAGVHLDWSVQISPIDMRCLWVDAQMSNAGKEWASPLYDNEVRFSEIIFDLCCSIREDYPSNKGNSSVWDVSGLIMELQMSVDVLWHLQKEFRHVEEN